MKLLKCLSIGLMLSFIAVCHGQTSISSPSLFDSLNRISFLQDTTLPVIGESQLFVEQASEPLEPQDNEMQRMLARVLELQNQTDFELRDYEWVHFLETNQLETLFVPEFKMGFSKPLNEANSTFYQLGVALLRPAVHSIAWNGPSQSLIDDTDRRSPFVSLSIQSRF
ncbi:hypothetical protein KJ365_14400 [Glaciecola sp. XM2]|jgi:hypothetical protein|uniref:hypothetical protein n=1 Tax=Glaciecola sp. XM2 TaxID=1914931 RepID=UPI001BDE8D93|nr:hypothetical protein [Glaciecola sp. XM2]MBT1452080.1 hypothetical protein [Glaciecola sp. XM2]